MFLNLLINECNTEKIIILSNIFMLNEVKIK
jgi:hypothetical protein